MICHAWWQGWMSAELVIFLNLPCQIFPIWNVHLNCIPLTLSIPRINLFFWLHVVFHQELGFYCLRTFVLHTYMNFEMHTRNDVWKDSAVYQVLYVTIQARTAKQKDIYHLLKWKLYSTTLELFYLLELVSTKFI